MHAFQSCQALRFNRMCSSMCCRTCSAHTRHMAGRLGHTPSSTPAQAEHGHRHACTTPALLPPEAAVEAGHQRRRSCTIVGLQERQCAVRELNSVLCQPR